MYSFTEYLSIKFLLNSISVLVLKTVNAVFELIILYLTYSEKIKLVIAWTNFNNVSVFNKVLVFIFIGDNHERFFLWLNAIFSVNISLFMNKFLLSLVFLLIITSCQQQPQQIVYSASQEEAILDNMITRRSIRKYTNQQVAKEDLYKIMKSAMYAPSANNKQPWQVRVIQNQDILEEINRRFIDWAKGRTLNGHTGRYNEPNFSIIHGAPSLVIIARDKNNPYSAMDCGILLQNILLSAHALNLGTCPLGAMAPSMNVEENKDLLQLLNIPEGYEVAVNVALGYPDEQPQVPKRYAEQLKIIE